MSASAGVMLRMSAVRLGSHPVISLETTYTKTYITLSIGCVHYTGTISASTSTAFLAFINHDQVSLSSACGLRAGRPPCVGGTP